jgi:hypothetical protein
MILTRTPVIRISLTQIDPSSHKNGKEKGILTYC